MQNKPLNRDTIKYIAVFTMVLNHYAHIIGTGSDILDKVFINIGCFTMPTMLYFLVEGYGYTRSKSKYLLRLFIFSLFSLVPFIIAFDIFVFSVMTTITVCFLMLVCMERIENSLIKFLVLSLLTAFTLFCDWAVIAPIFTLILAARRNEGKSTSGSYLIMVAVYIVIDMFLYQNPSADFLLSLENALCGSLGIAVSGIVITTLYNGRQAQKGRAFSRWFFYIFYPVHLLILAGIRELVR